MARFRLNSGGNQIGGQTKVVYQPDLSTTSFTPATPLVPGMYRIWVRAISATNENSPWSIEMPLTILAD